MSSYQAVLAAVREWVKTQDQQFGIWEPRWELEKKIPDSTDRGGSLSDTYCAQVYRAIGVLVSEGALVKHGSGRDAVYMTPEADRISRERAEESARERQAQLETWRQRKLRLAGHRLRDISSSVTDIRLSPEHWDALLDRLDLEEARHES